MEENKDRGYFEIDLTNKKGTINLLQIPDYQIQEYGDV